MSRKLYLTPCGCVNVLLDELRIIDGDKIPFEFINVNSISINNTTYTINQVFLTPNDLISYLNTIFVTQNGYMGKFVLDVNGIYYTNPEQFTQGEIMITYGLKTLTFKIGNPPELVNSEDGYAATFSNGSSFSSPLLYDLKEVQVMIGNVSSEPINGIGHKYQSSDPLLPTNGIITFPYNIEDANMYVTLTQKPL
jgi:hypothetical protein